MEVEIDDFIEDASDSVLISEYLSRYCKNHGDFRKTYNKLFKIKAVAIMNNQVDSLYKLDENLKLIAK